MSSKIGRGEGVLNNGMNFLRNFLFLMVELLEPSILTTYWSNCRTSTTMPVLSHFRGNLPVWFCTRTWSPTRRGGRRLVWSDSRSCIFMWRVRSAISLACNLFCQDICGLYLKGNTGTKSRIWRPKRHMAGDNFVSLSGVFLYCNRALWKASLLRVPLGSVLPARRRFMDFTATSARQLLWAKATDDSL